MIQGDRCDFIKVQRLTILSSEDWFPCEEELPACVTEPFSENVSVFQEPNV